MQVPQNISDAIRKASNETGVDYNTLVAFAAIESNFKLSATSQTSVRGLFQITGDTWNRYSNKKYSTDPYDQAITASAILKDLLGKYKSLPLVAIAYNAGPGVADQLKGQALTNENIQKAVLNKSSYWLKHGIDPKQKVKEVTDYPVRLGKALGTPFDLGPSISSTTTSGHVSSEPNIEPPQQYDKEKSFFENACNSSAFQKATTNIKKAFCTDDSALLRSKIEHSKLAPLLKKA